MNDISKKLAAIEKSISAMRENMATKDDLKNLELKLLEKIDESEMEIIAAVDKHKADKENVVVLEKRVNRLEEDAGLPPFIDQ